MSQHVRGTFTGRELHSSIHQITTLVNVLRIVVEDASRSTNCDEFLSCIRVASESSLAVVARILHVEFANLCFVDSESHSLHASSHVAMKACLTRSF